MPILYLVVGALVGVIATLLICKPMRCSECTDRERKALHDKWIKDLWDK